MTCDLLMVNDRILYQDGQHTGAISGAVLRSH